MPRLIRRAPVSERLATYLDPWDFLLWLSELLNDDTYAELLQTYSTPLGLSLNILFILARGAAGSSSSSRSYNDDVFGDGGGTGWLTWFAAFIVHALTLGCCGNALYVFWRSREYRLFEQPVDLPPATPSARRVRVDSSPAGSSPLRLLREVVQKVQGARGHGEEEAEREVWELSVWDPTEACLAVFTLFSPGHVLLYFSLLPPATLDPRPSVTVVKAMAFGALLSLQLVLLKTSFRQQAKDSALLHGEVMNEYDNKFVRPSLNRPVRDVGTQSRESSISGKGAKTREVDVYTPTTIINRGFRTSPNPYVAQEPSTMKRSSYTTVATPDTNGDSSYLQQRSYNRPSTGVSTGTSAALDFSSPIKPHHEKLRERSPMKGDGGSMGAYSHAASPLRKAASSNHLRTGRTSMADGKLGSPLKRMSTPGGGFR